MADLRTELFLPKSEISEDEIRAQALSVGDYFDNFIADAKTRKRKLDKKRQEQAND